ncbi:MAG: hypothetical protein V3U54_13445 [Thermodesulfobacteriota bacterium]
MNNSWLRTGYNKTVYDYVAGRVCASAKALMYKKLIPKYAWSYLTDPNMLKEAIDETMKGPYREWSCPDCGITVFGPKKWIHLHLPIHGKFQNREGRGGEIFKKKFKIYRTDAEPKVFYRRVS